MTSDRLGLYKSRTCLDIIVWCHISRSRVKVKSQDEGRGEGQSASRGHMSRSNLWRKAVNIISGAWLVE